MVFSKLCHGPPASGDKGVSLTPQKSARGKFHQIGNEKRACVYEYRVNSRLVGKPEVQRHSLRLPESFGCQTLSVYLEQIEYL